ncbi:hypothetical protein GCM10027280_53420 [Micromonospora polyrhachis]|uniref:Nitrite reductase (NO-forming) n=1 Tax=Micromonospora polyrhachis TaxID=1282883 RepID=A0A7W7SVX2_9ACTN|nr:hypothetical protein [Micromonospora polyrhachis]MBB4961911.1 nitrite reductase (NO-forming) [Micromonospora polyrhachis]
MTTAWPTNPSHREPVEVPAEPVEVPADRQLPVLNTRGTGATGATGRANWHRRTSAIPLVYLASLVVIAFVHQFMPSWYWLAIHLLLLGAVTNAILIWSAHFTAAVLRVPAPTSRRAEGLRLALLNVGIVGVLTGGGTDRPWVGVAGAAVVFAAITAHLTWLTRRLRASLPARFSITVRYYLAAATVLLVGIPVGAWMLVVDDDSRPRLLLFHAHINVLGWVTLTILGTLLTLWPTVLRTRMADDAVRAAGTALPLALTGLALLGTGLLAWWRPVAVGGLALVAIAAVIVLRPAVTVARGKPPASFAAWSIAIAGGWLLVALAVDLGTLLTAPGPAEVASSFGDVLVPLLVGFAAQVLVGALAYLLPVALGGGPARVRERTAMLDRHWPQRVAMGNAALAVFVLPTPPYVRITTSMLVVVALLQFLIPAVRVLLTSRR